MANKHNNNSCSGLLEVTQGSLYYAISGDGTKPIVWMHGLPLNSESWYAQLQFFNQNSTNYIFDLRGYGRSSKLPKHYESVSDIYYSDLKAMIDHFKISKPTLVAFASSSIAAIKFAADHQDEISRLILINGSPCFKQTKDWPYGFDQTTIDLMIKKINQLELIDDVWNLLSKPAMKESCLSGVAKLKTWFKSMAEQAGRDTIKAFFTNIVYEDVRDLLPNIDLPTLIISSRLGQEVPSDTAIYMRQKLKNSQLVEINGIDHFAFATQTELINRIINQFIDPSCCTCMPKDQQRR